MNIMLVSVTERIREIGLRKALGATPRVIRRQFLVEASVLGLIGGVLGVLLGILGVIFLPGLIGDPISTSPTATVGALAIALAIGVLFGVYPASRAAHLAPIDALTNANSKTRERGISHADTDQPKQQPPALGPIASAPAPPRSSPRRPLVGRGRRGHDARQRARSAPRERGRARRLRAWRSRTPATGQTTVSWTSTTQFSKTVTEAVSVLVGRRLRHRHGHAVEEVQDDDRGPHHHGRQPASTSGSCTGPAPVERRDPAGGRRPRRWPRRRLPLPDRRTAARRPEGTRPPFPAGVGSANSAGLGSLAIAPGKVTGGQRLDRHGVGHQAQARQFLRAQSPSELQEHEARPRPRPRRSRSPRRGRRR